MIGLGLTSRARSEPLEEVARRLEAGPDAIALAAALTQPWADVVLSGAATPEQVQSKVTALDVRLDENANRALARLAEPAGTYWQRRSELAWN